MVSYRFSLPLTRARTPMIAILEMWFWKPAGWSFAYFAMVVRIGEEERSRDVVANTKFRGVGV